MRLSVVEHSAMTCAMSLVCLLMIHLVYGVSRSVDDEDEMLYGDSGFLSSPSKEEPRRSNVPNTERDSSQYRAEPTHWCVVVRENGIMEVRSWEGVGVIGRYFEEYPCALQAPVSPQLSRLEPTFS